jgi:predicted  nucleic acid-binding Zn-ribbon protein
MSEGTDAGLVNNAMQAMSSAAAGGAAGGSVDMASVLAKIQSLEREKQAMAATLTSNNARLAKLQEGKKAEMEVLMNSTISKWLEGLDTKDVAAKDQLKHGLQTLIEDGNESGVWNVIACASNSWIANVNSIESLTNEVNSYKEKEQELRGGMFLNESSRITEHERKRKADDIAEDVPKDIWSEFETIMMKGGGNVGEVYSKNAGMVDVNTIR